MTTEREFPATNPLDYRGAAVLEDMAAVRPGEHASVTLAKQELAPTRAAALESLDEFKTLCASLAPVFDQAFGRYEHAVSVGVGHYPETRMVHNFVQNARTMMTGGVASLRSIPFEIDNLTQYVVYQGGARRIEGRYKMASENIAALATLAAKLPHYVREMETRIERAPRLPVVPVGYNKDMETRSEIKVESTFETRKL